MHIITTHMYIEILVVISFCCLCYHNHYALKNFEMTKKKKISLQVK